MFVETRFPDDTRIPNAPPTSLSRADSRAQRIANLDPSGCKQRGRKRQAAAAGEASPSGSFSSANAAISIARGDLPAQDDQRQRRLAVLLIDGTSTPPRRGRRLALYRNGRGATLLSCMDRSSLLGCDVDLCNQAIGEVRRPGRRRA